MTLADVRNGVPTTDIKGGVVLSARLDGFRCWNTADLERVPAKKICANVDRDARFPPPPECRR